MKYLPAILLLIALSADSYAQPGSLASQGTINGLGTTDSVVIQAHPSYNKKGRFHRFFFGENYRKEWALPTKVPVIHLSVAHGGLKPLQLGGGMQSKSLRLVDKTGKEWVIRSVEKAPEVLLPVGLRGTFARDWVDDVMSAQHPYSALIVPPIAAAVGVPHANPVIGIIAPDKALDSFEAKFANMLVLLEEREPFGESDNTPKMRRNLQKDNDNRLDAVNFLRARLLDALIGDWDRHEDQWRWYNTGKKKDKHYIGVPRDRDQVFHVTEGILPKIASRDYILPTLRNFDDEMKKAKWLLFKTRFVNAYPDFQFSRADWNREVAAFTAAVTDSVLELALQRLPQSSYDLRHDELLRKLKSRRDRLPAIMDRYYSFIQKVVDLRTSDKDEYVQVADVPTGLAVSIYKLNKQHEISDRLMNKVYDPADTREIRIYSGDGQDSLLINNSTKIKLRLIGGEGIKHYQVGESRKKVRVYNKDNQSVFAGNTARFKTRLADDSAHTAFSPVNLYNIWMPMFNAGLNIDDGIIAGVGFKFIKQEGFRKYPYASMQQLVVSHSFSTNAFRVKYNSEWIHAIGNADITMHALIKAPDNTINFFGVGNETPYDKTGDYIRYHRTRINTYQLDPAFRFRRKKTDWWSIGPSLYYYTFSPEDNKGRFINNTAAIGSYDSNIVAQNKLHLGAAAQYVNDQRNSRILPTGGFQVNVRLQAYQGIGDGVRSFAQLIPEFSVYKSLNKGRTVVLAERIGGTFSIGHPAFYQSAFIGGHENLLGYRQYRFAGMHSLYNNLELRVKIADVASYILPGQLGLIGFWDIGRVWKQDEVSHKWHNGTGAGIYFAPASMIAANVLAGYSEEGWYPYFTLGLRF